MARRALRPSVFGTRPPRPEGGAPVADLLLSAPKWAIVAISAMFSFVLMAAAAVNVLPVYSTFTSRVSQIVYVLCPLIVLLGYGKLRVPIRVPIAAILMLVLQFWLTVCTFTAFVQLGRVTETNEADYLFLSYVVVFMAGAIGCFYVPFVRKVAFGVLLAFTALNALVGMAQFAKFGPALAIARMNNRLQDITAWDGTTGAIRLIGLTEYPENLAILCLMANGVFLGKLLTKRLNPLEYLASAALIGVAFAAQSRVMYLSVLITVAVEFALVLWHDRKLGLICFAIASGLLFFVGVKAGDKLAYGLRFRMDDPSYLFRRDIAWPQAYGILEERPATGIGVDRSLATTLSRTSGGIGATNRWSSGYSVDNGFLLIGAWGGYPGIFIYSVTALVLIAGLIRVCCDRTASDTRRIAATIALAGTVAVLNNSLLNNSFIQWKNVFWIALCGGMAMPAIDDVRNATDRVRTRLRRFDPIKPPAEAL